MKKKTDITWGNFPKNNKGFPKVLDTIIMSDQPTTCPKCGVRTEIIGKHIEKCPNCEYAFETLIEYTAYLKTEHGNIVDQTGIDENDMQLARDLFTEYGYNVDEYKIEIEPA